MSIQEEPTKIEFTYSGNREGVPLKVMFETINDVQKIKIQDDSMGEEWYVFDAAFFAEVVDFLRTKKAIPLAKEDAKTVIPIPMVASSSPAVATTTEEEESVEIDPDSVDWQSIQGMIAAVEPEATSKAMALEIPKVETVVEDPVVPQIKEESGKTIIGDPNAAKPKGPIINRAVIKSDPNFNEDDPLASQRMADMQRGTGNGKSIKRAGD